MKNSTVFNDICAKYFIHLKIFNEEKRMGEKNKIVPVSVVIPTMNRPKSLRRTIETYVYAETIPSQIIIVDQSQDKKIKEEVEAIIYEFCNITEILYVYQSVPSSTKSRNKAMDLAKEEILVFSDDDVDVKENTISNIVDIMKRSNIAMIAGLDEDSKIVNNMYSKIGYLLGTKSFIYRRIGHVTLSVLGRYPDNMLTEEVETQWAMGYFFVVRKSLVEKWKIRWDEKMTGYAYAEDLDFTYNYYRLALYEGYRCILSKKVIVKHLVSKEYRAPSKEFTYKYVINRIYLSYKYNMGLDSRLAIMWCDFWMLIKRILYKENSKDMLKAIFTSTKYYKDIKNGFLNYDKYIV